MLKRCSYLARRFSLWPYFKITSSPRRMKKAAWSYQQHWSGCSWQKAPNREFPQGEHLLLCERKLYYVIVRSSCSAHDINIHLSWRDLNSFKDKSVYMILSLCLLLKFLSSDLTQKGRSLTVPALESSLRQTNTSGSQNKDSYSMAFVTWREQESNSKTEKNQ